MQTRRQRVSLSRLKASDEPAKQRGACEERIMDKSPMIHNGLSFLATFAVLFEVLHCHFWPWYCRYRQRASEEDKSCPFNSTFFTNYFQTRHLDISPDLQSYKGFNVLFSFINLNNSKESYRYFCSVSRRPSYTVI